MDLINRHDHFFPYCVTINNSNSRFNVKVKFKFLKNAKLQKRGVTNGLYSDAIGLLYLLILQNEIFDGRMFEFLFFSRD